MKYPAERRATAVIARRSLRSIDRRGMSIFEFLGCFTAMVGGVVLGSMYLGIDVKEMAYTALERVHVIETRKGADGATGVGTTTTTTTTTTTAPPAIVEAAPTQTRIVSSSSVPATEPVADVRPSDAVASSEAIATPAAPAEVVAESPAPAAGFFAREDLITDQQRQALTRAYWDALGVCMRSEVDNRIPAIDSEGNWQLFDYLMGRKDGHLQAAAGIAQLDRRGVDDHVLAYADTAQAWHADGAKLFGRAVDLLTDAPTAQLKGPFAQSWQSASTQHRMEARLLEEKHRAVESYLNHAYQATP